MRYLKLIFCVTLTFLMMGSGTKEMKLTEGVNPGDIALAIDLEGISLTENHYKLVQFWAAYDAESRVKNIKTYHEVTRLNSENLQLISISFDENKNVFDETVKADKLMPSTQYCDSLGTKSKIYKTYRIDKGFTNLLINPEGVIVAKNIQPDKIKDYL